MRLFKLGLLGLIIAFYTSPVLAGEPRLLGKFKNWEAYSYEEPNGRVCYAVTKPIKTDIKPKERFGKKLRRGKALLQVSHRPAEGARNTISFVAGMSLKDDAKIMLKTDKGQSFALVPSGDTAWGENSDKDNAIVQALRAGNMAVVSSEAGKKNLADTFSLAGSSAALGAINAACGF